MRRVVGIGRGDADEQILVGFAGQQIAVVQRVLAEIGQQRVAAVIDLDRIDAAASPTSNRSSRRGLRRCGAAFAFFGGASVTVVVTSLGLTSLLPDRSITLPLVLNNVPVGIQAPS